MNVRSYERPNERANGHSHFRRKARPYNRTHDRAVERKDENRPSDLTDVRMTDGTGAQSNGRVNERTRKRTNPRTNERSNANFSQINL